MTRKNKAISAGLEKIMEITTAISEKCPVEAAQIYVCLRFMLDAMLAPEGEGDEQRQDGE